jgi:regulator-associated protein of mTOR
LEYNYQAWRQQRNEQVLSETLNQAEIACLCPSSALLPATEIIVAGRPWDKAVTTLHIDGAPLSIAFHAYDPHVAIANETDIIRSVL